MCTNLYNSTDLFIIIIGSFGLRLIETVVLRFSVIVGKTVDMCINILYKLSLHVKESII